MKKFLCLIAISCLTLIFASPVLAADEKIKIGFLVKQAEEPWFQTEWAFADKAGADLGLEVIKIAIPDGEKTLTAIDTLAASGAKGFVICVPDTKLGPAVKRKADGYGMKVIVVDDQFVNANGEPMTEVPTVMMAASEIGALQGELLWKEMQKRGWKPEDTAVMVITAEELETARLRTSGSVDALIKAGFPEANIHKVPTKSNDIPGALDAGSSLLARFPDVKNWLVVGMNDNTVLGGVRATEGQRIPPENVIAIGINGVDAVNELSKPTVTGFLGSILPSPDVHGYRTVQMLNDWIVNNVEPPAFTAVTDAVLITRENYKEELDKKGL
jgi:L-arabinose transport system substrate-binding protein